MVDEFSENYRMDPAARATYICKYLIANGVFAYHCRQADL